MPANVTIIPGVSIQFTGQAISNAPVNIVTPGAVSYTAKVTFYESYFPAGTLVTTIPFNPTGVNYIPVVYVKNVDPSNQLIVTLTTIGGGGALSFFLTQNGFLFIFNPISAILGPGIGGIDSSVGLKVQNASTSGTCACEIFMAI
jgi:hypothetical protein